jgi:DNA-binding transcriptional regulator GbsR (MarR family)
MQAKRERFIERAGLIWEQDGMPRIAGRIFALTLVTEDPLSLDEIAETLAVSKASVSNDTRLLERMGFVERIGKPGDRKDYYQATDRSFERAIAERIRRMQQYHDLIEEAGTLATKSRIVRDRLDDHRLAFKHVMKAFETALTELQAKHRRKTSG